MRVVNKNRVAFIEKVLLNRTWKEEGQIKTLRYSQAEEIIADIQKGTAFLYTVDGRYTVDGLTKYVLHEYKL
jgi:hypothetical protein